MAGESDGGCKKYAPTKLVGGRDGKDPKTKQKMA